ncbi:MULTISPECIES: nucleoside kinase [Lacrimispora]|jgi:uridine kinase|uniref:Phosphoglycerate transporter n=1 Tax=Lacrimispora celerecrescens TaxID=29354 RepID=A0A084JJL4_9FIRM|nr:nucleoside kinase [Lacrimispora celerecrescens]KEZ89148.1 phosphoglycerate transporter [Lacrimispora celerecrescens]MBW4846212.1 nucleoside kinase [Lachnospiraceae bacterium]
MAVVTINGVEKQYPIGTSYQEIAKEYQPQYENDILLVSINGKLSELHKTVQFDCNLHFFTGKDQPGIQTYHRSAIFVMMKAFYDVAGAENIEKVTVDFSLGKGYYMEAHGKIKLTEELLSRVKARMQEYVSQKIPIMKRSVNTDDAIDLFHKHRMYDKERLFRYRRVSRVNIYSIGGFEDYYYGYMVQNTEYIKYFDLILHDDGFMLMLPQKDNPKEVPVFEPEKKQKLFRVLKESVKWGERLNVSHVGALNEEIASGNINELILIQEALQEKKIAGIAERIGADRSKKFVMIAGPSSSGKTTFSHRLSVQLKAQGMIPHPIAVDDYFVNRVDSPKNPDGSYNYEVLESLDIEQFNKDMTALLAGETVEMPRYQFKTGVREYRGDYLKLGKDDILVIEGIHCLNDRLSYTLPQDSKFRVYVSALTQLNVDEHNRIPTTDCRLIRRMVRDARTRGASAQDTIRMWPMVRAGEEEYIFPFQESADMMFNSATVYELAVLKQYAEPLLFGIPRESPEYMEAKRLLKFLDYFLGVNNEDIPRNSIVREFIGGSCFKV